MDTHINIYLDTRKAKKDGSYPIIFRLTHHRKTTSISTGFSVPKQYWNEKKQCIRSTFKGRGNVSRINNELLDQQANYSDILLKLKEKKDLPYLSLKQLKDRLVGKKKGTSTVLEYGETLIEELKQRKKIGNARTYQSALNAFKKFNKGRDMKFEELNDDFLQRFETDFLSRGNSENGLSVHLRTLRAIFNKAIRAGVVDKEAYPFESYKIKSKPTQKRAIDYSAIQKIVSLKLDPSDELFRARNYFLISFYLNGASFRDMAHLKLENIKDGRVQYQRTKTGKFYDIKITESLQEILNYYTNGKEKGRHILPIIKRETLEDQYNDVLWALQKYNKQLKRLGKLAGIDETLTSYVSRHSFASRANNIGIPLTVISDMLGHQRLSTTQVYLAGLKREVIDTYAEQIFG